MNTTFARFSKRFLPYLFPAIVLTAAIIYLLEHLDQFKQLEISSGWWLVALFAATILQAGPAALIIKKLLKIFNVRLSFWEAVGLVFMTGMGNYLVPYMGGMGLRATYLKKKYGFSLGNCASTVGGTALLSISINAFIGLLVVGFLFITKGVFSPVIFSLFFGCLLLTGVIIFGPAREIKTANRFLSKLNRVWEGWRIISQRPGDLIILAFITFLTSLSGIIILYISFRVVSDNIALSETIIISMMTGLSSLVNLTPAGLGIGEMVIVFTSRALGQVIVIGVSVALIRRVVATLIIFPGGGVASYILSRSLLKSSAPAKENHAEKTTSI